MERAAGNERPHHGEPTSPVRGVIGRLSPSPPDGTSTSRPAPTSGVGLLLLTEGGVGFLPGDPARTDLRLTIREVRPAPVPGDRPALEVVDDAGARFRFEAVPGQGWPSAFADAVAGAVGRAAPVG